MMATDSSVRAAVMVGPGTLEIREFPRPELAHGAALLRVEACGICGTDLHTWRGETLQYGDTVSEGSTPFPIIPGHEIIGVLTEIDDRSGPWPDGGLPPHQGTGHGGPHPHRDRPLPLRAVRHPTVPPCPGRGGDRPGGGGGLSEGGADALRSQLTLASLSLMPWMKELSSKLPRTAAKSAALVSASPSAPYPKVATSSNSFSASARIFL